MRRNYGVFTCSQCSQVLGDCGLWREKLGKKVNLQLPSFLHVVTTLPQLPFLNHGLHCALDPTELGAVWYCRVPRQSEHLRHQHAPAVSHGKGNSSSYLRLSILHFGTIIVASGGTLNRSKGQPSSKMRRNIADFQPQLCVLRAGIRRWRSHHFSPCLQRSGTGSTSSRSSTSTRSPPLRNRISSMHQALLSSQV